MATAQETKERSWRPPVGERSWAGWTALGIPCSAPSRGPPARAARAFGPGLASIATSGMVAVQGLKVLGIKEERNRAQDSSLPRLGSVAGLAFSASPSLENDAQRWEEEQGVFSSELVFLPWLPLAPSPWFPVSGYGRPGGDHQTLVCAVLPLFQIALF